MTTFSIKPYLVLYLHHDHRWKRGVDPSHALEFTLEDRPDRQVVQCDQKWVIQTTTPITSSLLHGFSMLHSTAFSQWPEPFLFTAKVRSLSTAPHERLSWSTRAYSAINASNLFCSQILHCERGRGYDVFWEFAASRRTA